jgi:hypothetical protein
VFFSLSRAHSEPCMDGTGLGGVDGRLPRFALSSSELCERRAATMLWLCSGPRASTPCLARTHSNSKLWRHFSALSGLFLTCIRSADLRLPAMRMSVRSSIVRKAERRSSFSWLLSARVKTRAMSSASQATLVLLGFACNGCRLSDVISALQYRV